MAAGRRPIAGSASHREAVGAGLDHEERRAGAVAPLGGDEEELAVRGPGDERLGAVEDPVLALSASHRLQLQRVEQGPRLEDRQRRGGDVLAGEGGQVGRLLLGGAPVADRGRDGAGGERRVGDPEVAVGEGLADQDAGHGRLLLHDAAELLGDAEHVDAELSRLRRAARAGSSSSASASSAAGRIFASAKSRPASWNICCSSSGVTSKRPRDLLRVWRAGLPSFWAALKVRPAAVAVRKPLLVER